MGITSYIRRQFLNGVVVTDTIPAGVTSTSATFALASGASFPDGSVGPFIITVDQGLTSEEKMLIQTRSGATMNVASGGRGYNGTVAASHNANATVLHTIDAQDLDEANQTMYQTLGAIQSKGDLLVGSAANTLTRLAVGTTSQLLQVVGGTLSYVGFGVGQSQAVGASNLDGSQISPARSDHAHQGVTTFNGSAGAATGVASLNGGTGAISQTNGYGVIRADSNPPQPTIALQSADGHLSSVYTLTTGQATFLTTTSLAAGTWVVILSAEVYNGTNNFVELTTVVGTATATFDGAYSTEVAGTGGPEVGVSFAFVANVTVAGTLAFQAKASGTAGAPVIGNVTSNYSYANTTGYVAFRIA